MSNTVHRRQLFHWIGAHIKEPANRESGAVKYVKALKDSINDGLWFTISAQESAKVHYLEERELVPMICFTDNKISDCVYHASSYGKLGLGFPKKFVIQNCGMPVHYVSNKTKMNPYLDAVRAIQSHIINSSDSNLITHWNVIANNIKPMTDATLQRVRESKPKENRQKEPNKYKLLHRNYGQVLKYYVEHEWRIILSNKLSNKGNVSHTEERPKLKYSMERDLFSLVLPSRLVFEVLKHEEGELYDRIRQCTNLNTFILDEVDQL